MSGPPTVPPRRWGRFWMWLGRRKAPASRSRTRSACPAPPPVEVLGAVAAEHACADDDDVEVVAAGRLLLLNLPPGVARVPAENVVAEGGSLNVPGRGDGGLDRGEFDERHGRSPSVTGN